MILSFSPLVRKLLFISIASTFININVSAKLSDIQSTRMVGQAGSGVGSILLNESSFLNPASAVFYAAPTFYLQKGFTRLRDSNNERASLLGDGDQEIVSITDTSAQLKGGFSYIRQKVGTEKRARYGLSMASSLSKDSGLGLIYRYNHEQSDVKNGFYSQVVLGYTKIISPKFTLGTTIVDPFLTVKEYFKVTTGVQYSLFSNIDILADLGTGDHENFSDEIFTNIALQLQFFERFYLRYGHFYNKMDNKKGNSIGISWVGPKFSLDYSHKYSEIIEEDSDKILKEEKLFESSIALTVLF